MKIPERLIDSFSIVCRVCCFSWKKKKKSKLSDDFFFLFSLFRWRSLVVVLMVLSIGLVVVATRRAQREDLNLATSRWAERYLFPSSSSSVFGGGEEADSERARERERRRYLHDLERQRRSLPLSTKRISGSVVAQSTVGKRGESYYTVATARQRKTDYTKRQ